MWIKGHHIRITSITTINLNLPQLKDNKSPIFVITFATKWNIINL